MESPFNDLYMEIKRQKEIIKALKSVLNFIALNDELNEEKTKIVTGILIKIKNYEKDIYNTNEIDLKTWK
ncbi:hypothetical protein [Tortoise microvirus 18]|nr:hypothetical protein [Tortoise microvirus 18]